MLQLYIANWFGQQYQAAISTGYKIILTGHSIGGAEAVIAAVYAAEKLNHAPDAVVTYGAPLTGDQAFVNYYRSVVGCGRTQRFTPKGDITIPVIANVRGYFHVCPATEVDSGRMSQEIDDLYIGYQNGLAAKYGNSNSIKAGCDISI